MEKPLGNHWKTMGKPLEKQWKIIRKPLQNFCLGSLVWDLWVGIFGLGSLVWDLWVGICLGDLWFGIFCLGSLVWYSNIGGPGIVMLGEPWPRPGLPPWLTAPRI